MGREAKKTKRCGPKRSNGSYWWGYKRKPAPLHRISSGH